MNVGLPPVWMICLPVGDLAESLRRVQAEGGKVIKARQGKGGEYVYAAVQDLYVVSPETPNSIKMRHLADGRVSINVEDALDELPGYFTSGRVKRDDHQDSPEPSGRRGVPRGGASSGAGWSLEARKEFGGRIWSAGDGST